MRPVHVGLNPARDERDRSPYDSEYGGGIALRKGVELPNVRLRSTLRLTHGAKTVETPPCGKCRCEFVNVVAPQHWPIDTVALTCAMCGSVVEYVDGLLLMTVKQAIRERHRRNAASQIGGSRPEYTHGGVSGLGFARELVQMGIDGGLSHQDIAEAMNVDELWVGVIASGLTLR